jgi:hypothetical protein
MLNWSVSTFIDYGWIFLLIVFVLGGIYVFKVAFWSIFIEKIKSKYFKNESRKTEKDESK